MAWRDFDVDKLHDNLDYHRDHHIIRSICDKWEFIGHVHTVTVVKAAVTYRVLFVSIKQ